MVMCCYNDGELWNFTTDVDTKMRTQAKIPLQLNVAILRSYPTPLSNLTAKVQNKNDTSR